MTSLDSAWDAVDAEDTVITEVGAELAEAIHATPPPAAGQPPRLRAVRGEAREPSWSYDGEAQDTAVLPRAALDALVDRTSRSQFQTGETESIREGELASLLDDDRPRAQVPSAPPPPPSWGALPDSPDDAASTEDELPPFRSVALESQSSAELTVKRPPFDLSAHDEQPRAPHRRTLLAPDVSAYEEAIEDALANDHTDDVATKIEGDRWSAVQTQAGPLFHLPEGFVPGTPVAALGAEQSAPAETSALGAPHAAAAAAAWIQAATAASASAGVPFAPSPSFNPPAPSAAAPREGIVVPAAKPPQHTPLSHALFTPPGIPTAAERKAMSPARTRTVLVVGAAILACVAAVGLAVHRALRAPDRSGVAQSSGLVLPPGSPQPAPAGSPDEEVRAALGKLRDGMRGCVKTIGVLPGSSPAVPPSFGQLSGGAYGSTPSDWKTPVWACTHFSMDRAQRFQLQWQQDKVRSKGMAVAWMDTDADGKPDKAFAFSATLQKKGEVELGEIEPIAAERPLAPKP
ncbi:MAG: hypothetical protein WKG00_37485 [Polyangiaceae bacterium]